MFHEKCGAGIFQSAKSGLMRYVGMQVQISPLGGPERAWAKPWGDF